MRRFILLLIFLMLMSGAHAQTDDTGGVQIIRGTAPYTFPYFDLFLPQPYIILYDISGVIRKDMDFMPAEESQIIGAITSDPFESPFTYILNLPFMGQGALNDVTPDGVDDVGVQIFLVSVTSNTWNSPFLEQRDDYVTGILNSATLSSDIDSFLEFQSGVLVVYAPDDEQGFPTARGADGVLFTGDDPTALIPSGWSLVDISAEPFTIIRDHEAELTLIEAEDAELTDFSDEGYEEAFISMIEFLKVHYAFTEEKNILWDSYLVEFGERIRLAEQNSDPLEFQRALRDLSLRIPDGHVSGPFLADEFQREAEGGLGMVLRELDDGRVLVTYVSSGGAAERAGITPRAEIISINGLPIGDALSKIIPLTGPFSTTHNLRLEQLRFAHRGPIGTQMNVVYRTPAGDEVSVALRTEFDSDSFFAANQNIPLNGTELPVEFHINDSGIAVITIYSFSDDLPLTVSLWERAIRQIIWNEVSGVIIDLRQNGGGSGFLGDQLPAYFFDQPYVIGNTAEYSESRRGFVINPLMEDRFILPPPDLRYDGPVAVLVSPDCASACESFAWAMTVNDRAQIVGHYPTAGLGGSVVPIAMPADSSFYYTHTRAVDADGEISIEGKGVSPTIRVPLTEETVFSTRDVLMDAALGHLTGSPDYLPTQAHLPDTPELTLGEPVLGAIEAGQTHRYLISAQAGQQLDIVAMGEGSLVRGLVVRLYLPGDTRHLDQSFSLVPGEPGAGFLKMSIPTDITLIIEVAAVNPSAAGAFTLTVTETP